MTPPLDTNGRPNSEDDLQKLLGSDPLKWLESLAARQGANPEEFITSADLDIPEVGADVVVDEPGYVDYDAGAGTAATAGTPSRSAAQPAPATPPLEPVSAEVNPLAWLESLARRQGANPEEFVTEANLDIPEVAADVTVNEPGYTPYQATTAAPPPPPPPPPPPVSAAPLEAELTASETAALLGMDTAEIIPVRVSKATAPLPPLPAAPEPVPMDPLSGVVDPLAWLESLARRQGANPEELITSADLDVPIPAGAAVDEPGYVDYAPFPAEEAAEPTMPEPVASEPLAPEPFLDLAPSADDTLAWLEGLAAEQGAVPPVIEPLAPVSATPGTAEWLAQQAQSLAEHRARREAEPAFEEEEIEPAAPAELPAWLLESMPVEGLTAPEPAPLVEEITSPPQPEGLPDWLSAPTVTAESDLLQLLETAPAAAPGEPPLPAEEPVFDDPWAVALDEEFRHRQRQEEPEWYTAALIESEQGGEPPAEEAAAEEAAAALAEVVPGEMPSWLSDVTIRPEEATEAAPAEELPDWLADTIPGGAETLLADWLREEEGGISEMETAAGETPDWLAPVAAEAELPDWLREAAPVQPPAPKPVEPPAPPVVPVETAPAEAIAPPRPEPVARPAVQPPPAPLRTPMPIRPYLPEGEAYAPLRSRLQANPNDHVARLDLARALDRNGDISTCLGQYQALVQAEAMLDDVTADLNTLVARHPAVPQVRRVLGDALVRQGRLQDALDVYRSALEQL